MQLVVVFREASELLAKEMAATAHADHGQPNVEQHVEDAEDEAEDEVDARCHPRGVVLACHLHRECALGAAALYRLYLGIADGMTVARVWARRYSK